MLARGGLCAQLLRLTFIKRTALRCVGSWQLSSTNPLGFLTALMPRHTLPGWSPAKEWPQWRHFCLVWDSSNGKPAWPRLSQGCLYYTLRLFLPNPPFTSVSYASWSEDSPHLLLLPLILILHRHFPLELLIPSLTCFCKSTQIYIASKFLGWFIMQQ